MPTWKLDGSAVIEDAPDVPAPPGLTDPPDLNNPEPIVPDEPPVADQGFDPGDYTVPEVQEWVEENPDEAQAVLDLETEGKDRVTLTSWLTDFIAADDGT